MIAFPPFDSLEAAWLGVLEAAEATRDGRLLHAVLSITDPAAPVPEVVAANDALLLPRGDHTVNTVANTVFPANLYAPPELDYLPDLQPAEIQLLDAAADDLYSSYRDMLPELCGFDGNERGTYFGRLVSWPGKTSDGYNQLKRRVRQLRSHRIGGIQPLTPPISCSKVLRRSSRQRSRPPGCRCTRATMNDRWPSLAWYMLTSAWSATV